ncbi:tRNA lysidine(34) synthetase TilS [Bacillus piscicola]|uniref:tRNA lysidine(34) synthetase TilS n=1 Tax=Bacillus piscicola TaxID=1632684 RepID=UPI001F08A778|nr:tRNA lysidine(34) synthetase TilS [Bacillus piscicola]
MKTDVERWINEHGLLSKGQKILIAVSGGPDSMALLHFLLEAATTWNITIYAAHINHRLREDTAEADEQFVKDWCREHHVPLFHRSVDVKKAVLDDGGNVQNKARQLRYDALRKIMKDENIPILATGHHADDQVETMLMKLVTGRGILGELGMAATRPFVEGRLIRPLLSVTKAAILSYCEENAVPYRVDESNTSDKYTRNRFRHHVLPFLQAENPLVHRHVQQYIEWTTAEEEYIKQAAAVEINKRITERHEDFVTIPVSRLKELPFPLQRRGIHLILSYLCEKKTPQLSLIHIEQLLTLMQQPNSSFSLDWPAGLKVTRSYDTLLFFFEGVTEEKQGDISPVVLPLPGQVCIYSFSFQAQMIVPESTWSDDETVLLCKKEDVTPPFTIRFSEQGDRMTILGMTGRKKVNRIFIDEKVPRHHRERWPVITDAEGTILWLPRLKKSARHIQRPKAGESYVLIRLENGPCNDYN